MSITGKFFKGSKIIYVLLLIFISIPFFINLDLLPLRLWDEALVSFNAQEMYFDKDFLVTHSNGLPEMWNTKPPLLIWIQVGFMHLFGMNDLAVRLPSAIAGFATCLLIIWFSKKQLNNILIGFFASLILATSSGYIIEHSVRSADYDALLVFFSTATILFFFSHFQTKNNTYLHLAFLAIALGGLTKGISIFMMLPGVFIYAGLSNNLKNILSNKFIYINSILALTVILSYYFIREHFNVGYIDAVINNELGGRFFGVIEEHKHSFWYYYNYILDNHFSYYYYLVPIGFLFGIYSKEQNIKSFNLFIALVAVCYFLVISNAQTKLFWYNLPLYPLMAMLAAYGVISIYDYIKQMQSNKQTVELMSISFAFVFFIQPYEEIISKVYQASEVKIAEDTHSISHFLKDNLKNGINLDGYKYLYDEYDVHINFYANIYKLKHQTIVRGDKNKLNVGDKIIVRNYTENEFVKSHYKYNIINVNNYVPIYQIEGKIE